MNRRKVMLAAVFGSVLLGMAALIGLVSYFAVPKEEDDDDQ